MEIIEQIIHSVIGRLNKNDSSLFDMIVQECIHYTDAPVHSLQEMRYKRSTKVKGDVFEAWCVLYLRYKGYTVWLLKELPDEIRTEIGLGTWDVGIDLVARKDGRYSAIQCKFKRPRKGNVQGTFIPYNCVNWKEVSTFFSLCHRTQERAKWQHHIVMTNTKYVRRMGQPTRYDKTMAYGTFTKLGRLDLIRMIKPHEEPRRWVIEDDREEHVQIEKEKEKETKKEKEQEKARLAFFMKSSI